MAGLLYQLVHDETIFNIDTQRLTKDENVLGPKKPIPDIDTEPRSPVWGPLTDEHWGESYNRALAAFQMMTTDLSRWPERQGKQDGLVSEILDKVQHTLVSETTRPRTSCQRKRRQRSTMGSSALVIREAAAVLQPKHITIRWDIDEDDRDVLETEHKIVLQTKSKAPDSQAISGAEWRDKLRIMPSFDKLKLQFESLVLYFRKDDEDEDVDLLNTDWNTIQAIIQGLEIDDKTTSIKLRTMDFETKQNSTRMARCSYGDSIIHAFINRWDAISSQCAAGKGRHYCSKRSYEYI